MGQEEPPSLAAAVAAGSLPTITERLPSKPRRDLPSWDGWASGRYGGRLRQLIRGGRDARELSVFGYARLVVWGKDFSLRPDILEGFEVAEGRRFTLSLRPGHRWSDGHPFTTEDFRFWWEQVANNPALSPSGLPSALLAGGHPPSFEVLDATRLRFTWPVPNPKFLPSLAATAPVLIYRPAHVLKHFHPDYRPREVLEAEAETAGMPGWPALFEKHDRLFLMDNPALPSLQPWINTSAPPTERWLARRNPYFHRVDDRGRQLPYIDEVLLIRSPPNLITAKTAAGESDLQAKGLSFQDAALLKQAEKEGRLRLHLWPVGRGSQLALYPNQNVADPALRLLFRARAFRRALSLGIDRQEMVRVLYQGLGLPGANTLLPESPLYEPGLRERWARYDPEKASHLLDAMGLAMGATGVRRLPNGQPLTLVVETSDVDPAEVDLLEILRPQWASLGIELVIRSTGRSAARQRLRSGETAISLFYGLANGLATPAMSPAELAPTGGRQSQWPLWGLHHVSGGLAGEAPDLPAARQLLRHYEAWTTSIDEESQRRAWQNLLALHGEEVFSIGLIGGHMQPIAANINLQNLPSEAAYLYQPGAYFGRYRTDTLWYSQ